MRKILFALLCLCLAAEAKPARPANSVQAAVRKLQGLTDSDIEWNTAKARTADVTCSGGADHVLFGTGGGSAWIGIVPQKGQPQLMDFPINRKLKNGFCAKPRVINLSALSCKGNEEDCKPVQSCKQFSVDDEMCDPFTFYWDSRHQIVRWRR